MTNYPGQVGFKGYLEKPSFVTFNSHTPLVGFLGARSYAAENSGRQVSFTIGPDIESTDGQSLAGKRAIINTAEMRPLLRITETVERGTQGQAHPHHKVTPEQAGQIGRELHEVLNIAMMVQINKLEQDRFLVQHHPGVP